LVLTMTRTAARFTQADVARAAKAMIAAGCVVTGVRIDREGNIEITCAAAPAKNGAEEKSIGSLDAWRRNRHDAR
jgi:hypothetical protein